MPTPVIESSEGGQHVEWSETFHAFLFRAGIYLKRFWWILIITVAAGVLMQKWKLRNATPSYESRGEMTPAVQVYTATGASAGVNEIISNYWGQQIHTLTSDKVKKAALLSVTQQNSEYEKNQPPIEVTAVLLPNTNTLSLSASSGDWKFTQLFLQAWMEEFLAERREMREQSMKSLDLSLTGEAVRLRLDRDDKTTALNKYLEDQQIASVDAAQAAADELEKTVWSIEAAVNNYKKQLIPLLKQPAVLPAATKPGPESPVAAPATPGTPESDPYPMDTKKFDDYISEKIILPDGTVDPRKNLQGRDVEIIDREILSHALLPVDPSYEENKKERERLQAKRAELMVGLETIHPSLVENQILINKVDTALQEQRRQRVDALEKVRLGIKSELKQMTDSMGELLAKNKYYLEVMRKINDLKVQIKNDEDHLNSLVQSSRSLEESLRLVQEMLVISQPATVPDPRGRMPDQGKAMTQGAFVGFAGGIVIIFLLGMVDGRVMSVEDLTQRFDEPMLGVIPMQKRVNGQVELIKHNDQRQMFAESCRNIRSSLLYMDRQGQRPRVIMLTSSMPSEGKSTLSSNLAITLGFAASRTLLVDADMRRGQLHKRFGLKNDVGLAEHIEKGVPLEQVIQPTTSENLDFIPCGKYPVQPGELLMSDRFKETIQTLRQRYDFVVFDSPPILLTDDAASFATRADAVIFVVRAGYTRMRQVRSSLESLHRRGVNVYGMVVNFIDHREPGYYTYRYYDYYSYRADGTDKKKSRSA